MMILHQFGKNWWFLKLQQPLSKRDEDFFWKIQRMWFLQKNHQKEWVMTLMIRNDCRSWSDHDFSGVWVIFRPRKCTHSALSNKCYLTPNKASFAIKWSFLPQIPYRKYSLNHGSITQWASFIHMRIFMYIFTVELWKQLDLYYTSSLKITQGNWD